MKGYFSTNQQFFLVFFFNFTHMFNKSVYRYITFMLWCFTSQQSFSQHKGEQPRFISDIQLQTMGSRSGRQGLISAYNSFHMSVVTPTEQCRKLLFKYAQLMDVEVEKLGDVSLLEYFEKWVNENGWNDQYRSSRLESLGFAGLVMQDVYHVPMPESLRDQMNNLPKVKENELQFGDVIFLGKKGEPRQSAIYLADGHIAMLNAKNELFVNNLKERAVRKQLITGHRLLHDGASH